MKLILPFIISFNIALALGSEILYLMPVATKSHRNVFDPLIFELAKRNHHITIVSPYASPNFEPHQNVREIRLAYNIDSQMFTQDLFSNFETRSLISGFLPLKYVLAPCCESYLQNPQVKQILKQRKHFDLVIVSNVYNDCALATAPLFGSIIIMQSATSLIPWTYSSIPQPPSFIPLNVISMQSKMNLIQRLNNAVSWIVVQIIMRYDYGSYIQGTIEKNLAENPILSEAEKKVSLILTNADPVLTSPRPSVPTIQDVGGMQCKKAKPVPKELEEFIQTAGNDGFIMFSLGSFAQSKSMPKTLVKDLLQAFSRLKQNVIWKYEEELEDLPSNVKISKWLPQRDLLGHPKIRIFITHGGMLSLQESIYNAVPLVAIPLFAEQPGNAARVVEIGIGIKLDFQNISGISMYEAINRVLDDKSYVVNMKKYSAIFNDFIENQVDKAAYWVEYVIRHKGAGHLQTGKEELNFFQYFLLDVIVFILCISYIFAYVLAKIVQLIVRKKNRK
uniref:UDP-glycosyltransferase 211D1 n=1 Tax=Strigamia maritima TaxID=126957 RepID=A0A023R8J3_STRMM|nr:UDP-glycosyltransferase 211D1 [Strigamia maritima]